MDHIPAAVKTMFYQLNLNCIFMRVDEGITTESVLQILRAYAKYVRSIYLMSDTIALVDIVPKNSLTVSVILNWQPTAFTEDGEEVPVFYNEANRYVVSSVLMDYAWALVHGFCPALSMDINYLFFTRNWTPAISDHRFTCAGPRSL